VKNFSDKVLKVLKTSLSEISSNASSGEVVSITKEGIGVNTPNGVLLIKELKPEGKPKMDAYAWTNGVKLKIGQKFE
jgi:methionyl-tRNA formyltransferase